MSLKKFTLEVEHIEPNPAKLLSIASSKFENDWLSIPHTHSFTEIFYIKSGKGEMQIEDDRISLSADQLIVINPYIQHTEISNPSDPLDYYVLCMNGLVIPGEASGNYTYIHAVRPAIRQCFENTILEMEQKKSGYENICQDYLEILLLLICRKNHVSYTFAEPRKSSRECHRIKEYIDTNYQNKITLDSLSRLTNLNKYYLSHKFSEIYGQSPIAYLNQVRIHACQDLLRTTNYSIEDIADMTGFSSRSYLAQAFQKSCHMTAQEYRKAWNNQQS